VREAPGSAVSQPPGPLAAPRRMPALCRRSSSRWRQERSPGTLRHRRADIRPPRPTLHRERRSFRDALHCCRGAVLRVPIIVMFLLVGSMARASELVVSFTGVASNRSTVGGHPYRTHGVLDGREVSVRPAFLRERLLSCTGPVDPDFHRLRAREVNDSQIWARAESGRSARALSVGVAVWISSWRGVRWSCCW